MESQDQVRLTNVGTVLIKGGPNGDRHVVTMFDLCSTDNWVSQATLKHIQYKFLRPFNGLVKTLNGIKKMELPRVEVRVKLDDTWLKMVCLVVPDIGVKAAIEPTRFDRLVRSFNMEASQFDTSSGPISLLIGPAQQSTS